MLKSNSLETAHRTLARIPAVALALLSVCMALVLCACGARGGAASQLERGQKVPPLADPLSSLDARGQPLPFAAVPVPAPGAAGLPGLAVLDALAETRSVRVTGPGWLELTPWVYASGNQATANLDGSLTLNSGVDPAYAIFGAYGFDGDSFPTSLRLKLYDGSSVGEYYVGFSDYTAGAWAFAGPFNADVTAEIPNLSAYSDPEAYISPGDNHYVCVLAPTPAALTIVNIELGVDGGDEPPLPPISGAVAGGDGGALITLGPSPSAASPDFAGYLLERAPVLAGDFHPVNVNPSKDLLLFDPDASGNVNYRWRARSMDAGGEGSLWLTFSGGPDTGNTPPVPRLKLPYGKLHGPLTITLDLSSSFDPDGDTITQYGIAGGSGLDLTLQASPIFTVTLQPGCYNLLTLAQDGAVMGFNTYALKVYPQWEPSAHVICNPQLNQLSFYPRLQYLQMSRDPGSQLLTLAGYNISQRLISIFQQDSGGGFTQHYLPAYSQLYSTGEALNANEDFFMPLANAASILLLHWDPTADGGAGQAELVQVSGGDIHFPDIPPFALASIALDGGGNLWCFFVDEDGGMNNLMARNMWSTLDPVVVDDNIGTLSSVDSELNASTGLIEIAAGLPAGLTNYKFNPADGTTEPPIPINAAICSQVDLEINPANDRPAVVCYNAGTFRKLYAERDGLGVWSPGHLIDNSAVNDPYFSPLEFTPAGEAFAWLAVAPGQGGLYLTDSSSSSRRNAPADFSEVGTAVAMIHDQADDFIYAGSDDHGRIMIKRLKADGTDSNVFTIDSQEGQGFQLSAAAEGTGDLHAVWQTLNNPATRHYMSADGGTVWSSLPDELWPCNVELGSDGAGNLYLATADGANDRLWYWDSGGLNFVTAGEDEPGHPGTWPILSNDPTALGITWLHTNNVLTKVRQTSGNPIDGFGTGDLTTTLYPLWAGSALAQATGEFGSTFHAFAVGGGSMPSSGYCAYYESLFEAWVFNTGTNAPNDVLTNSAVLDSSFAAAKFNYLGLKGILPGKKRVYYAVTGEDLRPSRFFDQGPSSETLEVIEALPHSISDFYTHNLLRTLSATTVHGTTAVMVLCSLDGEDQYMEWSNFGDFEALPMPEGIGRINRPQLVVTPDGRWHLIYHKPGTDVLFCRSTL